MPEPDSDASDELLAISVDRYPLVDVPIELVVDVTTGKVTANAFTTYVIARVRSDRRLRTSNEKLAKLRRVSLELLEKHLAQLEKVGWITFRESGIHVNDIRFQPEDETPSLREWLEAKAEA